MIMCMRNISKTKTTSILESCLESCEFWCNKPTKQDNEFYIEFGQGTPEGEDWIECLWYDGTFDGFVKSLQSRISNFDIDKEAETWIPLRGKNGVPSSIADLLSDAKWKYVQLNKLLKKIS